MLGGVAGFRAGWREEGRSQAGKEETTCWVTWRVQQQVDCLEVLGGERIPSLPSRRAQPRKVEGICTRRGGAMAWLLQEPPAQVLLLLLTWFPAGALEGRGCIVHRPFLISLPLSSFPPSLLPAAATRAAFLPLLFCYSCFLRFLISPGFFLVWFQKLWEGKRLNVLGGMLEKEKILGQESICVASFLFSSCTPLQTQRQLRYSCKSNVTPMYSELDLEMLPKAIYCI